MLKVGIGLNEVVEGEVYMEYLVYHFSFSLSLSGAKSSVYKGVYLTNWYQLIKSVLDVCKIATTSTLLLLYTL